MNTTHVLAHVLGIARGVGTTVGCAAVFSLAGSAVLPQRWDRQPGRGETPALVGAALYVLLCWFGVAAGVSLARLSLGFSGAVVLLAGVRHRGLIAAFKARRVFSRATLGWILAFAALYVLAYLFTMPPVTAEYLPPAWTGNIDLLTYVQYTKALFRPGPWNVRDFYNHDVYLQTPAVFYLFGWLSMPFGQDPLAAAMPAQFALTALIGLLAARISRAVFGASPASGFAVAAILVSGPFFRYVAGAYYLSTLMSMPVLLYLIWTTVACRAEGRFEPALMVRFAAAYVLLLFLYPFLFFAGVAAQAGSIALLWLAEMQGGGLEPWTAREAARHAARTIVAMVVPLGLLAVGFYERLAWSATMVRSLSGKGVAGWPLDMISPLALFGLPGTRTDRGQCGTCIGIEILNPASRGGVAAAFGAVAVVLVATYFWWGRRQTTPGQRAFAGLAAGSLLAYLGYFALLGPSYQQWKFASYSALPLSFVVFAGAQQLLRQPTAAARLARTGVGRQLLSALLGTVAVGCVGGNLLAHALGDLDTLTFPGELRNVAQVDRLSTFRELTIQMDEDRNEYATRLAIYFLPSKRVHVISVRFQPHEPLSWERVSRQRPLLRQGYGCEGIGHTDTLDVPDIGCLLFAPPSLTLDTSYPFSRSFLFIGFDGLGSREPEGRRNDASTIDFTLTADLRRAWVRQDAYVNLLIDPYLPPGTTRQRVRFSWGGQRAEASLGAREWISLPVGRAHWTGEGIETLRFSVDLPDALTPPKMYAPRGPLGEGGPLAAVFEELSVSVRPRGRVATATADAAR